jgi:hypothetical protein
MIRISEHRWPEGASAFSPLSPGAADKCLRRSRNLNLEKRKRLTFAIPSCLFPADRSVDLRSLARIQVHPSLTVSSRIHREISSIRSRRRVAARDRAREKRRTTPAAVLEERARELEAAYAAVGSYSVSQAQIDLVNQAADHEFFAARARSDQTSQDRIYGAGHEWPGGLVAGKYWQNAFTVRGLRTWQHPLLECFLRCTARASSGDYKAGPAKDRCYTQRRKIHGADEVYFHFGQRCRDMWRIELDKSWPSVAAFQSALFAAGLPFLPHVAAWVFDDRLPGQVLRPHLYFLLTEGNAVWQDEYQQRLLRGVVAGLTKALLPLGADPGGLANPFHGKNPLSVHCDYEIIQDTHFPMLSEYAEGLDVSMDPRLMTRVLACGKLVDAGFDPEESNTFFSWSAQACWTVSIEIYKSGSAKLGDRMAFAEQIAEVVVDASGQIADVGTPEAREALIKMIGTCATWTAERFDPRKLDRTGKDRGAAAHLMSPDDDAAARRGKGGSYAAGIRAAETDQRITRAMMAVRADGRDPHQAPHEIADKSGRSIRTVKRRWFPCFVSALASECLHALRVGKQLLVQGVPPSPGSFIPTLQLLNTANQRSDIPNSWQDAASAVDWRDKRLRNPSPSPSSANTGLRTYDFLVVGGVKRFAPPGRQRAA